MRESFSFLDSSSREAVHLHSTHQTGRFSPDARVSAKASRRQVLDWLAQQVPEARIQHILRVEEMAIALANCHQLDEEQAAKAGLLHDLAKFFKPKRLLEMAEADGLEIDAVAAATPHLLHAEVGAIVARDEFGVNDPVILDAIRSHTLGRPGMSPLSCVVFLADSLELGRGNTPELEHLRQVSQHSLHRAVWLTCDYSLHYLLSSRHPIHPLAVLTRNWAMEEERKKRWGGE